MAHLLLVTQDCPPDVGADQRHFGETSAQHVHMGHQVTVLTTLPSYPTGTVPEAYHHRRWRREVIDGINVVHVWSYCTPKLQPHERVPTLLAAAHTCLVPVRNMPLFQGTPSIKMFEARAAARPIVLAATGDSFQLAERHASAAIAVVPGNAHALAQAIVRLRDNSTLARKFGHRGRTHSVRAREPRSREARRRPRRPYRCSAQLRMTRTRTPCALKAKGLLCHLCNCVTTERT